MKKIKAIISLTLVCLMLIPMLVSCNKDGAPDGYKLVACDGDKFRLFVPTSWISNTESGITGAYSTVDENANVCVYMVDGYRDVAIGDYWAECDENYKESFSEYKLESLDEKSANKIRFSENLAADVEYLATYAKSEATKAACASVYDAVRYADPTVDASIQAIENVVAIKFADFDYAVKADDADKATEVAHDIVALLMNRDNKCELAH